jgi:MinD-like ATPase involved in chromosome partitioning or flagellar assembly
LIKLNNKNKKKMATEQNLIEEIKSLKNIAYIEFLEEIKESMKKGTRIFDKKYDENFNEQVANIYVEKIVKDLGFRCLVFSNFCRIYLV